jgi:alpha-L-fucosidase
VDAWDDDGWRPIANGTTIGYKKLDRLEAPITMTRIRLVVEEALAEPLIAEIGLYLDGSSRAPREE